MFRPFVLGFICVAAAVGALNFVLDPLQIFHRSWLTKAYYSPDSRLQDAGLIRSQTVLDVVFNVRGRDDHSGRSHVPEDARRQCRKPWRVEVLDDLHEHGRVVPGQPLVGVAEGAVPQLDPVTLARASSSR